MIGILIGFVLLAALVGVLAGIGVQKKNNNRRKAALLGWAALALVVAAVLIPLSIRTVDTGEIAVVKHLGKARGVRTAGTYFDLWLTNEYQRYDAKVQNVTIHTMTYSSDAQTMDVQMTLQYQIMSDKVIEIAQQYGSLDLLQNRIESIAIEKTKAVLSARKAMDIIADRAAMSPAVESAIKTAVDEDYFVTVTTVVLTNIDFSDAFETAVEEKMIAEQRQLKAQYENQTKVAQAEADARAKIIEAQAEAEANQLLEQSLTEKILKQRYLDKWNGQLPQVVGEGTDIMISLNDLQ